MCLLGHTSSQGLPRESWQREERAAIMRLDVIQNLTIESLKGLCQCPRKSDCHLEVTPDHLKMREPMWTGKRVRSEGQNWKNSTTCPGSPLPAPPHPVLSCLSSTRFVCLPKQQWHRPSWCPLVCLLPDWMGTSESEVLIYPVVS